MLQLKVSEVTSLASMIDLMILQQKISMVILCKDIIVTYLHVGLVTVLHKDSSDECNQNNNKVN